MKRELQEEIHQVGPTLFFELLCIECNDGWFDLLVDLTKKLEAVVKAYYEQYGREECSLMYPTQIKEKYGTLRFYMSCETYEIEKIIEDAENRSAFICEICGEPGTLNCEHHWYSVRCHQCISKT
jgi:hypothetical protein